MALRAPDMNPIRFIDTSKVVNYASIFPTPYNISPRLKYYSSIGKVNYLKEFIINQDINIQFGMYNPASQVMRVYKLDNDKVYQQVSVIAPVDITPTGWVSEDIYKYTYRPTTEGVYYFTIDGETWESDDIFVISSLKYKKRLIEIQYWNTTNDYGMIFHDLGVNSFKAKTYFEGDWTTRSQNDISGIEKDRGGFYKTKSTPISGIQLNLYKVYYGYDMCISKIFSCDNIYINGIQYENKATPESDKIEQTPLYNYKVDLTEVNNNYSSK